jgi:hypothetical protein
MKKLLLFLLVCLFSFNLKAQDPLLFGDIWYVHKVVIENEEYFPPYPPLMGIVYFDINGYGVSIGHPYCEDSIGRSITYVNNDQFILDDFLGLPGACANPEYLTFMGNHYKVYYDPPQNTVNPFSYSIVSDGNNKTLTIINNDGNYAIYGDEILSISEFNLSSISIYPNPVEDTLLIENISNIDITSVKIYDILGRLVLQEYNQFDQINVSNLDSGVLFVHIETNHGTITKKVIKE